jgi:TolB protein
VFRIGLAILPSIVIVGLAAAQPIEATDAGRGGEIAFSRIRHQTGDIYVVNADGSGVRNLTRSRADDAGPSWSPDGRRIAFRRSPADRFADGDIYVMNADGSGQRRLTRTPADDWEPSWSPDGRRIAFMRFRGRDTDIYVTNADGSMQPRLVRKSGFGPQWSPDGQKIAFLRRERVTPRRPARCALYLMNPDGTKPRRVAPRVDQPSIFSWSPRGRRIAFASAVPTASPTAPSKQIRVVWADSGRVRNLTPKGRWNWGPAWSPDGRRIAFWSGDNDDAYRDPGEPGDAVIQVMNADGSRARKLTATGSLSLEPAWSSDGKQIAFVRGSVEKTLWVTNADGSGQRKLAAQVEPQTEPVWKPQRGSMALDMANSNFCRAA